MSNNALRDCDGDGPGPRSGVGGRLGSLFHRFPRMQLAGEPSFSPSFIMRAMTGLPVDLGGPS